MKLIGRGGLRKRWKRRDGRRQKGAEVKVGGLRVQGNQLKAQGNSGKHLQPVGLGETDPQVIVWRGGLKN